MSASFTLQVSLFSVFNEMRTSNFELGRWTVMFHSLFLVTTAVSFLVAASCVKRSLPDVLLSEKESTVLVCE